MYSVIYCVEVSYSNTDAADKLCFVREMDTCFGQQCIALATTSKTTSNVYVSYFADALY